MPNPAWSVDDITFTNLPGAYRYGGRPIGIVQSDVYLQSDSGVEFNYIKFARFVYEYHWRVSETELNFHLELYAYADGRANTFYFSPSGFGPDDSILVRLSNPNFDPQELDSPGNSEPMFDYIMTFHEVIV
jgi:hypothetical protein